MSTPKSINDNIDILNDDLGKSITSETKTNKIKKGDTKISTLFNKIEKKILSINKEQKELKSLFVKLQSEYNKDAKKANKNKSKKNNAKLTGFRKPVTVPPKIHKYLKLQEGEKLSRNDIARKINQILKEKNLLYEKDKRVFRADEDLLKLFNLDKSVNDVVDAKDKSGFNFYNIQSHIRKCFVEYETEQNVKNNNEKNNDDANNKIKKSKTKVKKQKTKKTKNGKIKKNKKINEKPDDMSKMLNLNI